MHKSRFGLLSTAFTVCLTLGAAGCNTSAGAGNQPAPGGTGAPDKNAKDGKDSGQPGAPGKGGRGRGGGGAVPVSVATVAEKSLPVLAPAVGNIEAFSTVEVRPQVSGPLLTVEFNEGQDVKEGQLLFTIDPRPFDTALKQAQATLDKDRATVENGRAVLKRYDQLLADGLMPKADHDTYAATVKSMEETLKVDQTQVDAAQLQLQNTKITAPIAGRTGAMFVHKGALVRTGDTNPMVVINQITPVRAVFSVPAKLLPSIRAGQGAAPLEVEARPSGQEGEPSVGKVSFIDNVVDQTTATIRLKATFPNRDRKLWPGEFVEITLQLAVEPHALIVPAAAVQNGQNGQYVYVVAQDKSVSMRPVKVSRSVGDDLVVSEGLKKGEDVVTDGQRYLTPGVRVSIKPAVFGK